ncbi:hypothetical protein Vadar_010791 [Vaccinium darrowii]|uniref:Uncharacterized protein n=1 Tax=Vaccinium darrowii TaxID=229202 RepID=A0ACB7X8X8_9ERIC|nr:hypothetical protein Vadar_010791 [Vaccinium darrowii]
MDSLRPSSAPTKNKLAKTFHRVIHLNKPTNSPSKNSGFCLLIPQENKPKHELSQCFKDNNRNEDEAKSTRNKAAAAEAFVAQLFATISALKAAYADIQMAQFPYNREAIQSADQAVVNELKSLSELKQAFLKKQIYSCPPHVTFLLAEIQEQQSLMKMYEMTMKKMRLQLESKDSSYSLLRKELDDIVSYNKSLEKKLNSSGQFSILDCVKLSDVDPGSLSVVLHYAIRSIRCFVKLMVKEMESSNWDIVAAANAIVPGVVFTKANHRCFAFESFVCREMLDGFNSPDFFMPNDQSKDSKQSRFDFANGFKKLKAVNPVRFLKTNPDSAFGKFVRTKYMPFAEMAKRVWLLHCLAFSGDQEVNMFEVGRNCRFSEVYMECVNADVFAVEGYGGFRVAFMVVPGFMIGKTVIQGQVYLSPAGRPETERS